MDSIRSRGGEYVLNSSDADFEQQLQTMAQKLQATLLLDAIGGAMTRSLAEVARLGMRLGADFATFAGLAGIGDLMATCTSVHSRNRRAGELIGRGESAQRVQETIED